MSCYHYRRLNACSIRQALGQAVCTALDLDPETVATIRRHLAAEPSITAQRYAPCTTSPNGAPHPSVVME